MKTVLYCRVSTVDQTLDHQRTQAQQSGFTPDLVLADHGVSGISTRLCERPEGRRLFDILRGGDTLVVRWADRLGRNYEDVTDAVREFIRRGIRIETVINRMTFDGTTTDPMQQAIRDSLLAFMAAMSQAQAEVTKEAQKAGIAHALANDDGTKYRGRKPTFTCEQFLRVRELLNQGIGLSAIAKTVGLKRQSVYRKHPDGVFKYKRKERLYDAPQKTAQITVRIESNLKDAAELRCGRTRTLLRLPPSLFATGAGAMTEVMAFG